MSAIIPALHPPLRLPAIFSSSAAVYRCSTGILVGFSSRVPEVRFLNLGLLLVLYSFSFFPQNSFGSRAPSLAIFSSSGNFSRSGSGTFTFDAFSMAISSSAFTTALP